MLVSEVPLKQPVRLPVAKVMAAQPTLTTQPALSQPTFSLVNPSPLIHREAGKLHLHLALGYVACLCGHLPDVLPFNHLALIIGIPIIALALLSGRLDRIFSSNVCRLFVLFTAWMIVGVPFA